MNRINPEIRRRTGKQASGRACSTSPAVSIGESFERWWMRVEEIHRSWREVTQTRCKRRFARLGNILLWLRAALFCLLTGVIRLLVQSRRGLVPRVGGTGLGGHARRLGISVNAARALESCGHNLATIRREPSGLDPNGRLVWDTEGGSCA